MRRVKGDFEDYKEAFIRTFTHSEGEATTWKDFIWVSDAHNYWLGGIEVKMLRIAQLYNEVAEQARVNKPKEEQADEYKALLYLSLIHI